MFIDLHVSHLEILLVRKMDFYITFRNSSCNFNVLPVYYVSANLITKYSCII